MDKLICNQHFHALKYLIDFEIRLFIFIDIKYYCFLLTKLADVLYLLTFPDLQYILAETSLRTCLQVWFISQSLD